MRSGRIVRTPSKSGRNSVESIMSGIVFTVAFSTMGPSSFVTRGSCSTVAFFKCHPSPVT